MEADAGIMARSPDLVIGMRNLLHTAVTHKRSDCVSLFTASLASWMFFRCLSEAVFWDCTRSWVSLFTGNFTLLDSDPWAAGPRQLAKLAAASLLVTADTLA